MTVLGVDYGAAHVGLALGDSELKLAVPLRTLHDLSFTAAVAAVGKVARAEHVAVVVVGSPRTLSGRAPASAPAARFRSAVETALSLPVVAVDERLTTKAASALRRTGGDADEHALAAALILQTYLDRSRAL
jgi:putative Holliday junction resolvase